MATSFSNAQREEAKRLDEEIRERAILEGRRGPTNGKGSHATGQSLNNGHHKVEGDDLPFLSERDDHQSDQVDGANTKVKENDIKAWPIMESRATHGIAGRIARVATENSEADPVAVIATTLTYAAAEFGRARYTRIGDDIHHSRHFGAIVGQSSRARKVRATDPSVAFSSLRRSSGPANRACRSPAVAS